MKIKPYEEVFSKKNDLEQRKLPEHSIVYMRSVFKEAKKKVVQLILPITYRAHPKGIQIVMLG